MRSQVNDETDDECFDDPIKLFDSEHARVHFGSQAIQDNGISISATTTSEFKHSTENVTIKNDAESTTTLDSNLKRFSKRDCLPLHVKLVDCSKFPWYYRRYTQQILDQTSPYDLVSDSDSDIDIKHTDYTSDDCFIIDVIANEPNKGNSKDCETSLAKWPSVSVDLKTPAEVQKGTIKRREDIEIEKALSQKYRSKVDFKRNKGLIGMTIKHKYVKDINQTLAELNVKKTTVPKIKENQEITAKSNISASGKALNSIEIVPTTTLNITENEIEGQNFSSEENHSGSTVNVLGEKNPAKFSLRKISEELLEHVKTKKCQNKCQDKKLPDNKISEDFNKYKSNPKLSTMFQLSSSSNNVTYSSHTVKNIKKTNKYKKYRLQIFENKLLERLPTESNEMGMRNFVTKKTDKKLNSDENSLECIEKTYKSNSPIFHCSIFANKHRNTNESVKVLEEKFKVDKRDSLKERKSISSSDIEGQVVNDSMSSNFKNSQNIQRTSEAIRTDSSKLNSKIKNVDRVNEQFFENKILERVATESNKTEKLNVVTKNSGKKLDSDENFPKCIEKTKKLNSPIFHCSIFANKPRNTNESVKVLEEKFKVDKRDSLKERKSISSSDIEGQVVNDSMSSNFKNSQNIQRTSEAIRTDSSKLNSKIKNVDRVNEQFFENKILERVATESNKTEKLNVVVTKNSGKKLDSDENFPKCIEKTKKLNSPIFHCSIFANKPRNTNESVKVLEEKFKVDKRDSLKERKTTSSSDIEGQVVNNSMSSIFDNSQNMHITSKVSKTDSSKIHPKITDVDLVNEATETLKVAPVECHVDQKNKISVDSSQPVSSNHKNIITSTQNCVSTGYNVSNTLPLHTKMSSNAIPLFFTHPKTVTSCISNANGMNDSNNMFNHTTVPTQCKPNSSNNYDSIKLINTCNLPMCNESGNAVIFNNFHNGPPRNSHISDMIVMPPQLSGHEARFSQPTFNTKGPPKTSVQMKPRFYHNPYQTNYYRLSHNDNRGFIPRIANSASPNYRFPTPLNNSCNSLHVLPSYPSTQTNWRMPNIFPKFNPRDPRNECPRNFPPRLPITVTSTPYSAKLGIVSVPKNIAQSMMMSIEQDNSSQVLNKNKDTIISKSVASKRKLHGDKEDIVQTNAKNIILQVNSDLVTTKTNMLKLLDSATNDFKISVIEDDNDTEKRESDTFKRPKVSNKIENMVDFSDNQKPIDHMKGYSPPILPIPTFEKVLDQVKNVKKQDKHNISIISQANISSEKNHINDSKRAATDQSQESARKKHASKTKISKKYINMNNCFKGVDGYKSKESTKKEKIKKISLDEYKKRISSHRTEDYNKSKYGYKRDLNINRSIIPNKNKSRCSTESDHGYDSDSTVIL